MYDVIVVGARVAGASTALLLARRGLKVLAVDRASFPERHALHPPGPGARRRAAARAGGSSTACSPRGRRRRPRCASIPGRSCCEGASRSSRASSAVYSPRRTLLDKLLVDAAREAGAEVRERFAFDELVFDGDRVTGIRGRSNGGVGDARRARLVVGADGRHSAVAKAVRAAAYRVRAGALDRLLHVLVGRRAGRAARCTAATRLRGWSARGRRTTGW